MLVNMLAHPVPLNFFVLIMLLEEYRLLEFLVLKFSSGSSHLIGGQNFLLSTLFSNTV
jgi:hypothetical protein